MITQFEDFQNFGVKQFDAVAKSAITTSRGLQAIASEASDYSSRRLEAPYALAQKLLRAKKTDEFVGLHSNFAKAAFQDFIATATKINKLYFELAKEAPKALTSGGLAHLIEDAPKELSGQKETNKPAEQQIVPPKSESPAPIAAPKLPVAAK